MYEADNFHLECDGKDSEAVNDYQTTAKNCELQWLFEYLPDEILQKIFSYFSQYQLCQIIAPVCRRWRDLAYDPFHWQSVTLDLNQTVEPEDLELLLGRASWLKHFELSACRSVQVCFDEFRIFDSDMLYLKELHLTFIKSLNTDHLNHILVKTPCLEHLNVEGCELINNDCIDTICHLDHLKILNISHCRHITDDGIIKLATNVKCLCSLNIDGITHISDRSIECLVKMHFKNLVHLYLDGEDMSDLKCISKCIHLQTLSISYATSLDDGFLNSIIHLSEIEVLRLRKGDTFSRSSLKYFFEHSTIKKLKHLNLAECVSLDDSVLLAICLRHGQTLQKLVLSWCWEITDVGLEVIVNSCRVLHHLNLVGLHAINGQCFQNVPETMPYLQLLDLTKCNAIEDSVIAEMITRKPDIIARDYYGELYEPRVD